MNTATVVGRNPLDEVISKVLDEAPFPQLAVRFADNLTPNERRYFALIVRLAATRFNATPTGLAAE